MDYITFYSQNFDIIRKLYQKRILYMRALKIFSFMAIFIFIFYTLLGFFGIPYIMKNFLPEKLAQKTHLHVRIEKIYFNPFSFYLNLENTKISDKDGFSFFESKNLHANLDIFPLFSKLISFEDIGLDLPSLSIKIDKEGKTNLLQYMEINDKNTTKTQSKSPWNFEIKNLEIKKANINLDAKNAKKPIKLSFSPLNLKLKNLSSKKDFISSQTLDTKISNAKDLSYKGTISLNPLNIKGRFNIKDMNLNSLVAYGLSKKELYPKNTRVDMDFSYEMSINKNGIKLDGDIKDINFKNMEIFKNEDKIASLKSLDFKDFYLFLSSSKKALEISKGHVIANGVSLFENDFLPIKAKTKEAKISNINIKYDLANKFEARIKNIDLNQADLKINLFEDKNQSKQDGQIEQNASKGNVSFKYLVDNININNSKLDFSDKNEFNQTISSINAHIKNISSDQNKSIFLDLNASEKDQLKLSLKTDILANPFSLDAKYNLEYNSLEKLNPYIQKFIKAKLTKGKLGSQGDIKYKNENLILTSNAKLKEINLLDKKEKKLISLGDLDAKNINFNQEKNELEIENLSLENPSIDIDLQKNGKNNFDNIFIEHENKNKEKSGKKFDSALKKLSLKDGELNLKNQNLPSPSNTLVNKIKLDLDDFYLNKPKNTKLKLNANINETGFLSISGNFIPKDIKINSKIDTNIRNLSIKSINAYTQKYLGYDTKKGTISSQISQNIKKGQLQGKSETKIQNFNLGKKVKSKDALNVPLELALSLLKDSNGDINLNIPFSGDMNSPDFSYGSVIVKTIIQFFTSIVSAPFNIIGNVLGVDADKLKSVDFQASSAILEVSENAKMDSYVKIIQKYPKLKLSVQGTYDKKLDAKEDEDTDLVKLATLRANAIKEALLAKGLTEKNIIIQKPKEINSKDKEWIGCEMGIKN